MNAEPLETLLPHTHYAVGTSPAPAKARFWDRVAQRYATDTIADARGYDNTLVRCRELLQATDRVLELGCGTGTTALRLAPTVASYLATDVSAHMVAIAQEKHRHHPCPHLQFATADADAPVPDAQGFDAVLAFNLLHLVTDLDGALRACAAQLRPGGLLITKTACLREMNPLVPWLAVPVMRLIGKAPPVLNLACQDLTLALLRQGLEIVAVERHATRGRDVRPFIVARKPANAPSSHPTQTPSQRPTAP